jgi:YHS domain-containing protein
LLHPYGVRPCGLYTGQHRSAATVAINLYVPFNRKEEHMEKDVVCGMQVDPTKAAATSEYQGKTYYFCAKACKIKFDANPSQYVK